MTNVAEQAITLLRFLIQIEEWDANNDPRARPYFDADAVRRSGDGHLSFHPQKLGVVMKAQGD